MSNRALTAYYDFRVAPLTFDYAVYLAIVCGYASKMNLETVDLQLIAPFFRMSNQVELGYPQGYKEYKFHNVILKLSQMVEQIKNIDVIKSRSLTLVEPRFPPSYHPGQVDLSSGLTQIPCNFVNLRQLTAEGWVPHIFKANEYSLNIMGKMCGKIDICLTLRNTPHKRNRDCELEDWYLLYAHLVTQGLSVIVIPDHDDVLGPKSYKNYDWKSVPEAALDLDLRLALNQMAGANIAWASGHNTLLYLNDPNFLIFGNLDETESTSNSNIYKRKVIDPGTQPDWFIKSKQIFDWTERSEVDAKLMIRKTSEYLSRL